jgi:hypothetical protein
MNQKATTLTSLWQTIPPAWRFSLISVTLMRIFYTLWSLLFLSFFSLFLQNLDLFGEPVLAAFNLQTSERYAYSRQVGEEILSFQIFDADHVRDQQTGSIWFLRDGKAVEGFYTGTSLASSSYSAEKIFPYVGVPPTKVPLLSLWQRFDANWYLKIATRGYDASDGSTVYFPVYPLLIRAFSYFVAPMIAATLISNLALLGCLVLLYRLIVGLTDAEMARRSLIYFLIFPTAFFLIAPYTESLFLLFTVASFYCATQRRWGWAILWGTLSALTRLQGALLVLPLGYMLWRESRGIPLNKWAVRALPLMLIPLSTVVFLAVTNLSLINTYQQTLHAQFVLPWENIMANISLLASGEGGFIDAFNLIVTIGLVVMMYFVWKKLPFEYTVYSLLMLLAPMMRMTTTQPLVSMSRYALAIFPMFIVFALWGRNVWVNRIIVYTSVLLQLYLSAQFFLWGWVA